MNAKTRCIEEWIGAVIIPEFRPQGGEAPGAPERVPSQAYLERFPPAGLIGFGRRMPDGQRIDGLEALGRRLIESANTTGGRPPFICADLECGAGYHLPGASLLPPARALAAAEGTRPGSVADAAELTGREACAAGIDLVLAPVLDVNTNPKNPIIGVRAFGRTVDEVSAMGRAYLGGLARAGAGACIKHYPGHGDTSQDSHLTLPTIDRSLEDLEATELAPFDRVLRDHAVGKGTSPLAVMVAHLDVPALTGAPGRATSLAPLVMQRIRTSGFDGVVMTDGLAMKAVCDLPDLGVQALLAGCDGLLAPVSEQAMAEQLLEATAQGRLPESRLEQAAGRMTRLRDQLAAAKGVDQPAEVGSARDIAAAALEASPGFSAWREKLSGRPLHLIATSGFEELATNVTRASDCKAPGSGADGIPRLVISGAQNIAGNGASGLGPEAAALAIRSLAEARHQGESAGFLWFGAPEGLLGAHLDDFHRELGRGKVPVLVAFAPSEVMVDAVGELLASRGDKIKGNNSRGMPGS